MKKLIRLPVVMACTGLSRSEIYRLESLGRFPVRVPLSPRSTAWDEDEVQAWVRRRIEEREEAIKGRCAIGRRLTAARTETQTA